MDKQDQQRNKIYLAALLHDIGKFYQRADTGSVKSSAYLTDSVKKAESTFCPPGQYGKYSHKHVLWTLQFFEDFASKFSNIDAEKATKNKITLSTLAASHHKPGGEVLKIILQKADHLSSGSDRTKDHGQKDSEDELNWDGFKKKRMVSIFESLFKTKEFQDYNYRIPVEPLNLKNDFSPKDNFNKDPDYKSLWKAFVKEFSQLKNFDEKSFAETVASLLKKYTSTVPSSTMHLRDVSLYDHAKTTAAFSVCLYDYLNEKNGLEKYDIDLQEDTMVMIGGDLSGIQSFIYDIISKNAAKNLKGRSFYLELLTDSIIHFILKKLNLYESNLIYGSGGKFYILAPNTSFVQNTLKEVEETISEKIFETHETSLYFAIAQEKLNAEKIFEHNIGEAWQQLNEKLNQKKRQRYSNKLVDDYEKFFEPIPVGKKNRDAITGFEIYDNTPTKMVNGVFMAKSTFEQIELGKLLKNSKYWIRSDEKIPYWERNKVKGFDPIGLGIYHYFLTESPDSRNYFSSVDNATIRTINSPDFLANGLSGKNNIYDMAYYGGNNYPAYETNQTDEEGEHEAGDPKTFDQLAGNSDFKRIGILRMDADSLGQVFMSGFDKERRTFSRYSTLSRNLDHFFKGYINTIWNQEKYRHHTFIVYAGGDDIFIVGQWNVLIEMAVEINNEFKRWTAFNDNLTLSGGIAIVSPKFPIMKGAVLSADAEEEAKSYVFEGKEKFLEKSAFSLMGVPLHWKQEMPMLSELKNEMVRLLKDENLPKAILSNIYSFYEARKHQKKYAKNESWQWQMAYQFSRISARIKNPDANNLVNRIKTDVFADSWHGKKIEKKYHTLEMINLAARWAELEIRTLNN